MAERLRWAWDAWRTWWAMARPHVPRSHVPFLLVVLLEQRLVAVVVVVVVGNGIIVLLGVE